MLSRVGARPGSTALVSLSPREGKYLYLGWLEGFCLKRAGVLVNLWLLWKWGDSVRPVCG